MLSVLSSRSRLVALWAVVLAAIALAPQGTAHAQGSGSFGPPGQVAAVLGSFYETGVTIEESVPADSGFQVIDISDQRRLHTNMFVEVGNEEMWITALTETNPSDPFNLTLPDTMTVDRAQNSTPLEAHGLGDKVKANVARVIISVNDLTTPVLDCDVDEVFYTGSDLAADMDDVQASAQVTNPGFLSVGMDIRINLEEMKIIGLAGDVITVMRAQNGTTAADHDLGTFIYAKNTNPTPQEQCGLGGYEINLQFDETKARYISLVNESFLTSTGRSVLDPLSTCAAPDESVPGVLSMQCNSSGITPQGGPIIGALGSGVLATALFEPLEIGRPISDLDMSGSLLFDIRGNNLSGVSVNSSQLQAMTCPDTNNDGFVNILDVTKIALNFGDTGQDSGATIAASVDGSQTSIEISAQGTLAPGDTVAVDFEQMHVNSIDSGPPVTLDVNRGVNGTPAKTHDVGMAIYRAFDGSGDGAAGYTLPRDTNPRVYGNAPDMAINILDATVAARVGLIMTTKCP